MNTAQHLLRLIHFRLRYWLMDMGGFGLRLTMIPLGGLVLRGFFNFLTGEPGTQIGVVAATLLQLLIGLVAVLAIVLAFYGNFVYRYYGMALMIRNLVARILALPGAVALPLTAAGKPQSTGQVIITLRDDTRKVSNIMINRVDDVACGCSSLI